VIDFVADFGWKLQEAERLWSGGLAGSESDGSHSTRYGKSIDLDWLSINLG
jgi:hypothetical protein